MRRGRMKSFLVETVVTRMGDRVEDTADFRRDQLSLRSVGDRCLGKARSIRRAGATLAKVRWDQAVRIGAGALRISRTRSDCDEVSVLLKICFRCVRTVWMLTPSRWAALSMCLPLASRAASRPSA